MTTTRSLLLLLSLIIVYDIISISSFNHLKSKLRATRSVVIIIKSSKSASENTNQFDTSGVKFNKNEQNSIDSMIGNSIVSSKSCKAGDVLITLPLSMCLLAHRSGSVKGLKGQTDWLWDACGDLRSEVSESEESQGRSWDVQLALAGTGLGGSTESDGKFWDNYSINCLPSPESLTVPFCININNNNNKIMKDIFQNDEAFDAVLQQQQRLETLFPTLSDKASKQSHRITAQSLYRINKFLDINNNNKNNNLEPSDYIPTPLQWAFALVRSRCIQIDKDWFGMLPVIDIANHSLDPNAELNMLQNSENNNNNNNDITDLVICLCANRDIEEGEEITISYGDDYPNRRLFAQYGFTLESNPFDKVEWPKIKIKTERESINEELKQQIYEHLRKSLLYHIDKSDEIVKIIPSISSSLTDRVNQILMSNSDNNNNNSDNQYVGIVLNKLLFDINSLLDIYPTSLESDQASLNKIINMNDILCSARFNYDSNNKNNNTDGIDNDVLVNRKQLTSCILQRIEKKKLLSAAQLIVTKALNDL